VNCAQDGTLARSIPRRRIEGDTMTKQEEIEAAWAELERQRAEQDTDKAA
jgi:hypothetical protein